MPAPAPVQFVLPVDTLQAVAQSSGLQWVGSNPDKVAAVQAAIAAEPGAYRLIFRAASSAAGGRPRGANALIGVSRCRWATSAPNPSCAAARNPTSTSTNVRAGSRCKAGTSSIGIAGTAAARTAHVGGAGVAGGSRSASEHGPNITNTRCDRSRGASRSTGRLIRTSPNAHAALPADRGNRNT